MVFLPFFLLCLCVGRKPLDNCLPLVQSLPTDLSILVVNVDHSFTQDLFTLCPDSRFGGPCSSEVETSISKTIQSLNPSVLVLLGEVGLCHFTHTAGTNPSSVCDGYVNEDPDNVCNQPAELRSLHQVHFSFFHVHVQGPKTCWLRLSCCLQSKESTRLPCPIF